MDRAQRIARLKESLEAVKELYELARSLGALEAEQEMQALDEQLDPDGLDEQGQATWNEYQSEESSTQRWQESQADQDYWQQHQAPWQDHSLDCNCPACCGDEPPSDSPDDPVCDCNSRMRDLYSFFGQELDGHIVSCKRCGEKTFHQSKEDGICLSCGHSTDIDAEGSVYVAGKVTYDAEQA